tara:strand:- start:1201 stop:1641 length:441 start_codon:yes stop_codon:yes gene_type:complete
MVKKNNIRLPVDPGTLFVQVLLVVYIVSDFPVSPEIAEFGRSAIGLALVCIICLASFSVMGPVTGVLALAAAYFYLSKSQKVKKGTPVMMNKAGIDRSLLDKAAEENTLEEEMVAAMAPPRSLMKKPSPPYVPVLADQNGLGHVLN